MTVSEKDIIRCECCEAPLGHTWNDANWEECDECHVILCANCACYDGELMDTCLCPDCAEEKGVR